MDPKKHKPTHTDRQIIERVKQYLEENVHQTYVDVGLMAKTLQNRYQEYTRRKSAPFRYLVEQAYKNVLHSYGLDSNPSSGENDDGSDLELMEDRPDSGNHMNNTMNNMYSSTVNQTKDQQGSDGVLIDISSDESGGEDEPPKRQKTQNSNIPDFPAGRPISIIKIPSKQLDTKGQTTIRKTSENNSTSAGAPNNNNNNNNNNVNNTTLQIYKKRKLDANDFDLTKNSGSGADHDGQEKSSKQQKTDDNHHSARSSPITMPLTVSQKSSKKFKREISAQLSPYSFKDLGGMDKILKDLCELLLHIKHPQVYKHIGLPPPRGFLLHGPPGCGKTLLAQAIAGQLKVPLIHIVATELIAGLSGESEERIRELFEQAPLLAPCVLFIDEIDAISSNRLNAQKDMERRIVAQLLSSLDGLSHVENGNQVLVIGATNRADSLDPALRRVGRFDQEICLGIPDRQARSDILKIICSKLRLEQPFKYDDVAVLTPGYVGADLLALATRAASMAIKRAFTLKRDNLVRKHITLARVVHPIPTFNLTEEQFLMEFDSALEMIGADQAKEKIKENGNEASGTVNKEKQLNGMDEETIDITDEKQPDVKEDENMAEEKPIENTEIKETETAAKSVEESTDKATEEKSESPKDVAEPMIIDTEKEEEPAKEEAKEVSAEKEVAAENENAEKVELPAQADEKTDEPKPKESITLDNEDSVEVVAQEDANVDKDPKPVDVVVPENKKTTEKPIEDDSIIDISDETLEDQMLRNTTISNHLGLAEMTKWLNDKQLPISAKELRELNITMSDFTDAVKVVQPSAKREGFITVPDVTWNDIGSLRDIRNELQLAVLAPVKYPERLKALGLQARSGVLLCGPPGCGKTLLAKAVANEAGINFISVKGPELLNMYVGESERAVRQCFQRARNSVPCVIFFDEFDALCPKRSDSREGNSMSRVVNQLLTEMDGVEDRNGVFLMAATNRPDIVDPAVLRPGRLDKVLYVGLPNITDRAEILDALTKKKTKPVLADDVDLGNLAQLTENYTGADLAGLVRQASLNALKQSIKLDETNEAETSNDHTITMTVNKQNFLDALEHIKPSVSEKDKLHYEKLRQQYVSLEPSL